MAGPFGRVFRFERFQFLADGDILARVGVDGFDFWSFGERGVDVGSLPLLQFMKTWEFNKRRQTTRPVLPARQKVDILEKRFLGSNVAV